MGYYLHKMGQWASHLYGTNIPLTVPMHKLYLYLYATFTNKYLYIYLSFLPYHVIIYHVLSHLKWVTAFNTNLWRKAPDHIIRVNSRVTVVLVPSSWWSESFPTTVPVLERDIATDNFAIPPSWLIFVKPNQTCHGKVFSITLIQSIVPGRQWHMSHALIYKLLYGTRSRL